MALDSPAKIVEQNVILIFVGLGVTDDVTGQVKIKNIDIWSMLARSFISFVPFIVL